MIYAKHYEILRDDEDWLAIRDLGNSVFVFLKVIDLRDHMCESELGDMETGPFCASVNLVEVNRANAETRRQAMESCGWEDMPTTNQAIAEVLNDYGAHSPVWNEDFKRFDMARAAARRYTEDALLDDETRENLLETKVVNALGQSAREYAGGSEGLWDSLRRIASQGEEASTDQKLMLKMYAKAGQTLGCGPVPADIVDAGKS